MLPRIPFAQDFWTYSQAGRDLAHWHINYETIAPYELKESVPLLETDDLYRVQKMTFAKKAKKSIKPSFITIAKSPCQAYPQKPTSTSSTANPR